MKRALKLGIVISALAATTFALAPSVTPAIKPAPSAPDNRGLSAGAIAGIAAAVVAVVAASADDNGGTTTTHSP